MHLKSFILVSTMFMTACGNFSFGVNSNKDSDDNNGGNGGGGSPQPKNRVNWSSIPKEFNPKTEDTLFSVANIDRVDIDLFGFRDDVEVVYSPELTADVGYVRLFKVSKDLVSWGGVSSKVTGKNLAISNYGQYQCSIKVENGNITSLKGGCYIRLQVYMPSPQKVEVYSADKLISKRFFPVSVDALVTKIKDASSNADKLNEVDEFLESYQETSQKAVITSEQLGLVIHEFSFAEEKFKVLEKLHSVVTDRNNLNSMIEKEFSYFDREKARSIAGI